MQGPTLFGGFSDFIIIIFITTIIIIFCNI